MNVTHELGCEFFEGVVMKRADSIYPVQLRSPRADCTGWVKHRFVTEVGFFREETQAWTSFQPALFDDLIKT